MTQRIDLHIEEVVVSGVPEGQVAAEVDAFRSELVRLLTAHGLRGPTAKALAELPTINVVMQGPSAQGAVGQLSAQALHGGMQP